jgi:hypothetical protein
LFGAASAARAAEPLRGPLYPMPGGKDAGHGGNVCASQGTTLGSASGVTWTFGGGNPTSATLGPTTATVPAAFDTTRFARLYWGLSNAAGKRPGVAMDGAVNQQDETLSFRADLSNLPQGLLVWTGTTGMPAACQPSPGCGVFGPVAVATRLELQFTSLGGAKVALDSQQNAGITGPALGGVVKITDALTNFKVNMKLKARTTSQNDTQLQAADTFYNSYSHQSAAAGQYISTLDGAFWYENRAPIVDFNPGPAFVGIPVDFTATATDPDGTIDHIGWDFNNDGDFTDAAILSPQHAFLVDSPVSFQAADEQGATSTQTKTITLSPAPPPTPVATVKPSSAPDADGDGFSPPVDCNDGNRKIHPGAPEILDNNVDENCDGLKPRRPNMAATVSWTSAAGVKSTKFSFIRVNTVPAGSTITVICHGRKCPPKVTLRRQAGRVLIKAYKKRKLPVGDVIEVRITNPNYIGLVKTLKVRKRKQPSTTSKCLPAGATKPVAC